MLLKTKERLAGIMRLLAVLLTCLFCFLGSLSPAAAAPEGSGRKIRVGYYGYKNLLSVDGNGNYSGYIHSYLTDIARHTGWQHEFVYSSLKDCLERLESGEIDLMVSLQKTPEREKKFSFSKNYVAMIYGMLCVNKEQGDVYYEDFEKFDGMRVAFFAAATSGLTCLSTRAPTISGSNPLTLTIRRKCLKRCARQVDAVCSAALQPSRARGSLQSLCRNRPHL
jgi:hypothetical protein